jgi:ATP-dependent Lon protease
MFFSRQGTRLPPQRPDWMPPEPDFKPCTPSRRSPEGQAVAPARASTSLQAGTVQVFDAARVRAQLDSLGSFRLDRNGNTGDLRRGLFAALDQGGRRAVMRWPRLRALMDECRESYENCGEVIAYLEADLALSAVAKPDEFRVSPLLLAGEPGVGKTHFASHLADKLGLPYFKISAGSAHGAYDLAGSARLWVNFQTGRIFDVLAHHAQASAVVVIDELDKLAHDSRHPTLPVLLDLLEPHSAREFRDEAADLTFDASKLIVLCTANELSAVHPALKSRMEVVEVSTPTVAQRRRLVEDQLQTLLATVKHPLRVADGDLEHLARDTSQDLRQLSRYVRRAVAKAILEGGSSVCLRELPPKGRPTPMGFF